MKYWLIFPIISIILLIAGVMNIMRPQTYTIKWKSLVTGKEGEGITRFSESIADGICYDANLRHSKIDHWHEQ